jgi:hypothetical protein
MWAGLNWFRRGTTDSCKHGNESSSSVRVISLIPLSISISTYLTTYLPTYLSVYLWLYSPLDLGRFFTSLILYTVGRIAWTGDQTVAKPLPAHRTAQTQNKRTQTFMPRVGFGPTTPVFERAKAV